MFTISPQMSDVMKIASGIFWTITYILIIRRGFTEKTYGMPFFALCANISWEFIFSFILPHTTPQRYIDIVWFLFDCVIMFQFLRFGKDIFKGTMLARWFGPVVIAVLAASFIAVLTLTIEFNDITGKYAAFMQNLMMSVLFVDMLLRRDSSQGQSIYIAISKMIGTIIPSVLFYSRGPNLPFSLFLYISIFVADLVYTVLLYRKLKQESVNPWRRF